MIKNYFKTAWRNLIMNKVSSFINIGGLSIGMAVAILIGFISCFIAVAVAYYFLHEWLQKYEYRTEMTWWVFGAAGAGALIITLLTVSFQSIKAVLSNLVKSLRTE